MKRIYFPMALGICLIVCFSLFLYTVHAWALYNIPTYIELNFDDIEYNYAQYIKFTIESDGDGYDYKIVLYMRSNNGVTFTITYKISELAETGELNDENSDTLTIYLHADEYEGKKVTFNSYDYDPNLSFTRYVALWGEKGGEQDYSGGEAELRKILIYGYGFKLYYIALDGDGDFSDPSWKIDVAEEDWDNEKEFKDDGHTYTTATSIDFKDTYIHVTENPAANDPFANYSWAYPSSIYGYFPFQYTYGYGQPSGYGLPQGYAPRFPWVPNGYADIYSGSSYQYLQPFGYGRPTYGYPGLGLNTVGLTGYGYSGLGPYNPLDYSIGSPGYGGYLGGNLYMWPYYGGTFTISDNPWGPSPYLNSPFGHLNFGQDWITPGPAPLQGSGLFYLQPNGTYYNPITGAAFIT